MAARSKDHRPGSRSYRRRAGVAVVIVLAVISMTLALSYSLMRTQTTAMQIQLNSSRRLLAQDAAAAGLSAGLRRMSQSNWAGIGSNFSGAISASETFAVTYAAGDSALLDAQSQPTHSDYFFTVTITSVGSSSDPLGQTPAAQHRAVAKVRLVRSTRVPRPPMLDNPHTLQQLSNKRLRVEPPTRIEGSIATNGKLTIGDAYSWKDSIRDRYFTDLIEMRQYRSVTTINQALTLPGATQISVTPVNSVIPTGTKFVMGILPQVYQTTQTMNVGSQTLRFSPALGLLNGIQLNGMRIKFIIPNDDQRTVSGPVYAPSGLHTSNEANFLTSKIGIDLYNFSGFNTTAWQHPGSISTYRLYPGGPTYSPETLSANIENRELAPSATTNPLGIYVRNGDLTVGNNVQIRGTLIVSGRLTLRGSNLVVSSLPTTDWGAPVLIKQTGESGSVELPVLIASDEIIVEDSATGTIDGLIATWAKFDVQTRSQGALFRVTGRMIADEFNFGKRSQWDFTPNYWMWFHDWYEADIANRRFPEYLAEVWTLGLGYNRFNVTPAVGVDYYWPANQQHVFTGSSGQGLRWDVLEWNLSAGG